MKEVTYMRKVMIKTYDCFETSDIYWNRSYAHWCSNVAKLYDLDYYTEEFKGKVCLHLAGPKWSIVKYYLKTAGKYESKFKGIMRILDMIFTF